MLVIVTAIALLAYVFWVGRHEALLAAEVNVGNLTAMIESRFHASIDRIRASLDNIAETVGGDMLLPEATPRYRRKIAVELDGALARFPELGALGIFDAAGDLLYASSVKEIASLGLAHRPCFQQLRDDPKRDIVYSEVIATRNDGFDTVMVCRPLRSADGRFVGMIGAQFKLTYFRQLFESIDVGGRGVVAIRRSDTFALVLRRPSLEEQVNKTLPVDNPIRQAIAGGAREATLHASTQTDGVDRIFSLRALDNAPYYVLAAMAEDDVLAPWRARTTTFGMFGLLLVVVFWLTRDLLRRNAGRLAAAIDVARTAEERLHLLAKVFEHTGEAIVVSDAENRIVSVNKAFSLLTGYVAEDVLGQNPRVLSAGRTTPDEYADMWRAINERGRWDGEIWDRRKDGSCYPKWLTISTLHDAQGRLTHYIGSFTDISERKAVEQNIHHLAHHDMLTGLPNRFSLQHRLRQVLASANRDRQQVAVLFIDLDHFKRINDTLGHSIGDALLIDVAARLKGCVRDSDIVARLGGDEFVIVMTNVADGRAQDISSMARKIVHRLSCTYGIDGHELQVTPSVGISVFPVDGEDAETLMRNADTAMYHAKSLGRHNYQFFARSMNEAAAERLQLESAMRRGIERGEFLLHFQPQIEIASGRVVCLEALVRWQHPEWGLLLPDRFIPLAEEYGPIEALGSWVLEDVCRRLRELERLGYGYLRIAVNVCGRQLRRSDFADGLGRLLDTYQVGPGRLEVEVAESVTAELSDAMIVLFQELRSLGVTLSIDDFGTGYSSLGRLKLLPIQKIKLDRSFVADIETDNNDATICAASVALAHSLGLAVVAEGVETEPQFAYLRALDTDLMQGYYFCEPLPIDQLMAFLASHSPTAAS